MACADGALVCSLSHHAPGTLLRIPGQAGMAGALGFDTDGFAPGSFNPKWPPRTSVELPPPMLVESPPALKRPLAFMSILAA